MKKIISLTLVLIMLLSTSTVVFAEFGKNPESADFSGTAKFNLDFSGEEMANAPDEAAVFFAFLKDMKLNCKGTYIQKSPLAVQAYAELEAVAGIFNVPVKLWVDLDFTDADDITYKVIVETPEILRALMALESPEFNKQYILVDYAKFLKANVAGSLSAGIGAGIDFGLSIEDKMNELLAGIAVETLGENHYKMTLSDAQSKELVIKAIEIFAGMVTDMMPEAQEEFAVVQAELPKVYEILRAVELFPDPGIVTEYKVTADGYTSYEKQSMNMKIDIAAMDKVVKEVYPQFADDPAPDLVITLALESETEYTNINSVTSVAFPVLTADNSFDIFGMIEAQTREWMYEPVKVYIDWKYLYFPDAQAAVINDRTMVPASIIFRALGGEMTYIETAGLEIITGKLGDNEVSLVIGSNMAVVNGAEVELDVAAYINEDYRTMVPLRFIAENFGLFVDFDEDNDNCGLEVNIYTFML